ncbi:MAG: hypothetical protein P8X74_23795, partial [Reinekea sp.]
MKYFTRMKVSSTIATLLLLGLASSSQAFLFGPSPFGPNPMWGFMNNVEIYRGHVYARGLYRTP